MVQNILMKNKTIFSETLRRFMENLQIVVLKVLRNILAENQRKIESFIFRFCA